MPAITAATYQALFETAPDAILVVDQEGRIVLANAQAEALFGAQRAALIGQPIEVLVPERFHPDHVHKRDLYMRAGGTRRMGTGVALYARRRDGSEFPVEIALGPIQDGDRLLYAASVRDISDVARTREAALRGRYNSYVAQFGLRALKDPVFTSLIHAASPLIAEAMEADAVVVFRLTPDRRELECVSSHGISDAAAARMRAPNDRRFLPGYLVAERAPVAVPDIFSETRFGIIEVVRELGLRSALCVPLFGRDEVIGGLTARNFAPRNWTDDDIHFLQAIANIVATALERAATEETLLHAQRLEALGQLTGGVAHDFNNLLMVITGNLQMLKVVGDRRLADQELVRHAISAADRGALLTRKLLAFARKQPLHPRAVDLNHLVSEFRDLTQRTLGENVSVRVKLDPELPLVVIDTAQLETAMLNLALNARDAMPNGGVLTLETGRARIGEAAGRSGQDLPAGDYAFIGVEDSGSGMSSEVLARAIEPFFTTKGAGKGSGLGLSMVYGFARQSGGTLQLRSEPGRGTAASLYLPLPEEPQRIEAAAGEGAMPVGSETVLLVEDDAAVRRVAAAFLARLGYRVFEAGDGESALAVLQREPGVELLFTDLVLPGMEGADLARAARAMRPDLAVLYTSARVSEGTLSRLPDHDRGAVLPKPYRREELAFQLRKALASRLR